MRHGIMIVSIVAEAFRCGMQAAQRQGTVSQEIARQTDGVLLAVGALSSVLKKKVSLIPSCTPRMGRSHLQPQLQPHSSRPNLLLHSCLLL